MKWHSTKKLQFPKNNQEVFITVDGINYVAIYDENEKSFTVKNLKNICFKTDSKVIFWSEQIQQD